MTTKLADVYHAHGRAFGGYLGGALMLLGVVIAPSYQNTAVLLEAVGGLIGGGPYLAEITSSVRRWLTLGGAVLIASAGAMLMECHAGTRVGWCPAAWSTPYLIALATGLGALSKAGAWVPAANPLRVSTLPPPG